MGLNINYYKKKQRETNILNNKTMALDRSNFDCAKTKTTWKNLEIQETSAGELIGLMNWRIIYIYKLVHPLFCFDTYVHLDVAVEQD